MKAQVTEQISIAQAKKALEQAARLYLSKDQQGRYRIDRRRARPVCLMGPAGIGKTEIVRQVAEELGLAFLSYSVTHHTRQSALGLPQLTQREVDGRTVRMTEYTMSEIIAEVYRVMEETGKREGILFLDEFNCASETMRPIMLQLLQNKTFGPHAIPEGWMLVLAGNPGTYNAAASEVDAVTADRLRMLWLRPDYEAWEDYMCRKMGHPVVLSYLSCHRDHFYVFEKGADGTGLVTARGWEDLSVMLRLMEEAGYPVDLPFVAQYLQCAVVAREFYCYYQHYASLVGSGLVNAILSGRSDPELIDAVEDLDLMDQWALTGVLMSQLETLCSAPGREKEASNAMDTVLLFYQEHFEGRPLLEFMMEAVTKSDLCASFIAQHGSQAYRDGAAAVFFNGGLPTDAELRKAVS